MKKHTITGKIVFENIGPGVWGIVDNKGKEWRPINMPEQLKHKGQQVTVTVKEVDDMSIFMWGTPVKIVSFDTVTP